MSTNIENDCKGVQINLLEQKIAKIQPSAVDDNELRDIQNDSLIAINNHLEI